MAMDNGACNELYQHWLASPWAARQLEREKSAIIDVLGSALGCRVLYVGVEQNTQWLSCLGAVSTHQMGVAHWQRGNPNVGVWANDVCWPLPSKSQDVVILHHALEHSAMPHTMIKEAVRVLVPGGRLLVCSFVPLSWWRLVQLAQRLKHRFVFPNPISMQRLTDWLMLIDTPPEQRRFFSALWPTHEGIENSLGVYLKSPWLPSSAYLLAARKTQAGLIRDKKQRWQFVNRQLLGATPACRAIK